MLLPRQISAVRWILSRPESALFWHPGLGKTLPTLVSIDTLLEEGEIGSALVIAPLRVATHTWPREIEKWAPHMSFNVLHGRQKAKLVREEAEIRLINPEGFAWLCAQPDFTWPDMLVLDESTKWKNWSAQRTKALKAQLNRFKRRVALTGTPVANGYMDLFSQVFLLDGGRRFGPYITHYRNRYFFQAGQWDWRLRPGAEEEILEKIADLAHYVSDEELSELPDVIEQRIEVDLPPKARSVYEKLQREFFVELDDGTLDVMNAGVMSGKLRQIASGSVYTDESFSVLHSEKLAALSDLLDELQEPTLVVYEWKHELERLREKFGEVPSLTGKSGRASERIIDAWNRGALPMLAIHPASAGHGLNLQHGGRNMVFLNPTWDLEYLEQTVGRLKRKGQRRTVYVYTIEATKTLDQLVRYAVRGKASTQRRLFEALLKYRAAQKD